MNKVGLSNTGFAEISDMCKRGGDIGIRFYYEFKNLKVISLKNEENEAIIKGEIKLIQSGSELVFTGHFLTACRRMPDIRLTTALHACLRAVA